MEQFNAKKTKSVLWKKKQISHIVVPSLSYIIGYEGKAGEQSRKLVREPVNAHVSNRQQEDSLGKALVGLAELNQLTARGKKLYLYLQVFVHYISANRLVQRPPGST